MPVQYSYARIFVAIVLITARMVLGNGLSAQERAVSPTLLRVLGETVAACRPGPHPIFLVADYRFPHEVIGHFYSRADAERVRARSGSTTGVFGPYVNPADPMSHTAARVLTVTLTRRTASGRTDTVRVDPEKVDALFFSMSALDKFMVPYYSRLYGPEYALKLRQRLGPISATTCHAKSRVCYPKPDGSLEILRVEDPVGSLGGPGSPGQPPLMDSAGPTGH